MVLSLPDNVLLEGYYVSYKYIHHFADIIREDFSFRIESSDAPNSKVIFERELYVIKDVEKKY